MDNKKIVISFIVILVLILIIVGIVIVNGNGYNIIKKQYNEITNLIDKGFDDYKSQGANTKENANGKIDLDMILNFNSEKFSPEVIQLLSKIQTEVNKLSIEYDIKTDIEKEYIGYDVKLLKDTTQIVGGSFDIKNNYGYIMLKDILDEYIKIDLGENYFELIKSDAKLNIEDYRKLYKIVEDEIEDNIISKKNVATQKVTMVINGEEEEFKKHTLSIDEKTFLSCGIKICERIKEAPDLVTCLTNIQKLSNDKITDSNTIAMLDKTIKNMQEKLNNLTEEKASINLSVYTKGLFNKLIQYEIARNDITTYRVVVDKINKERVDLRIFIGDSEGKIDTSNYLKILFVKTNDNSEITFTYQNNIIGNISVKSTIKTTNEEIKIPNFDTAKDIKDLSFEDFAKLQDVLSKLIESIIPAEDLNSPEMETLYQTIFNSGEKVASELNISVDDDIMEDYMIDDNSIIVE